MRPIAYLCTPGAMMPVARFSDQFQREFEVGKYYSLEEVTERSRESHNHYFACVYVAWLNLPDLYSGRLASDDELRQWCLIKRNFRDQQVQVFESAADAKAAASLVHVIPGKFTVTVVEGNTLTVLTARTQKMMKNDAHGMDKKDFEASKEAVIEECAFMVGLTPDQLKAEAKKQVRPKGKAA